MKETMKQIVAYTEAEGPFPAYLNISEKSQDVFVLTVRANGNAGRTIASLELHRSGLQAIVNDASRYLDPSSSEEVEQDRPAAVLAELRHMSALLQRQVELMGLSREEQIQAMARYDAMTQAYQAAAVPTEQTFTFDQFVQYGRDNGGNIVRGMPWSFSFHGHVVSHENDQCYLVGVNDGQVRFTPDQVLVLKSDGTLVMVEAATPRV